MGDRREEVLLEGVELPEPGGHAIEGARQLGDLVTPADGDRVGELPSLDVPGRGAELPQGAGDPHAREEGDREGHRQAAHDREERHETALLLEAVGLGSAPAQLGAGLSVEPLDQRLELHRGLLDTRLLGWRALGEPPVAAKLLGGGRESLALLRRRHQAAQRGQVVLDGAGPLGEEPDVRRIAEDRVARLQAPKRGDAFEEADLETNRGQRALDDRAVLCRQLPRREETPPCEGQHHPREQGEGEEQLVAQPECRHGILPGDTYKRDARRL